MPTEPRSKLKKRNSRNKKPGNLAGLLDQITAADAQAALRRLSDSTASMLVVPMPLPMAQ